MMGPRTPRPGKPEGLCQRGWEAELEAPSWGWGRTKTLMSPLWDSLGGLRCPEGSAQ